MIQSKARPTGEPRIAAGANSVLFVPSDFTLWISPLGIKKTYYQPTSIHECWVVFPVTIMSTCFSLVVNDGPELHWGTLFLPVEILHIYSTDDY